MTQQLLTFNGNLAAQPAKAATSRPATPLNGAGVPLWGAGVRRPPILGLIAIALITMAITAPAALSGTGVSSNPLTLMHDIASSTYQIATLLDQSNDLLQQNDANVANLVTIDNSIAALGTSASDLQKKTTVFSTRIGKVGSAVAASGTQLEKVNRKITTTSKHLTAVGKDVTGSLKLTKQIESNFGKIAVGTNQMSSGLTTTIGLMAGSVPLTQAFANNRTRRSIVGGDGRKYQVANIMPGNRVMSVVLPMIKTMQSGGPMAARKDSQTASNAVVGFVLDSQVPNGTNIAAGVQPYDGTYGLPGAAWFVTHKYGM